MKGAGTDAWLDRVGPWSFRLAVVGLFAPFVALAFHARPAMDDFTVVNHIRRAGFWGFQEAMYTGFTGRYGSIFFQALAASNFDLLEAYHFYPLTAFGALLLGFLFLWTSAFPRQGLRAALFPASVLLLLYLTNLPPAPAATFWGIPVIAQGSQASVLVLAGSLLRMHRSPTRAGTWGWTAAAGVAAIIAVGAYEVTLLLTLGTLLPLAFWASRGADRQHRRAWATTCGVALVAAAVSVLAPGNFARAGMIDRGSPLHIAWYTVSGTGIEVLGLAASPSLLAGALLLALKVEAPEWARTAERVGSRKAAAAVVAWVALLSPLALAPGAWGYGAPPLPRMYAPLSMFWLLAVGAASLIVATEVRDRAGGRLRLLATLAAGLLLLGSAFAGNGPIVRSDLAKAPRYVEEVEQRLRLLEEARLRGGMVAWPEIRTRPTLIQYMYVSGDPRHWVNQGMAEYFGVEGIWRKR